MRVVLHAVGKGRRERALPPTSLTFRSGAVTLAVAETEQRPTVLGLVASGRMRPDTGEIRLEGLAPRRRWRRGEASALRRAVALVDAPGVSEPEPDVTLAAVVAEELMFAGRRWDRFAVRRWLAEHGLANSAGIPISNVAPADRVRALCELAVLRRGVEGIVLVSPDRHGGSPHTWWRIADEFAERRIAVLVIAGRASQAVIERPPTRESAATAPSSAETVRPRASEVRPRRLTAPTKGHRS